MAVLSQAAIDEIATTARARRADFAQLAVQRVVDELGVDLATRRNLEVGTQEAVDRFIAVLSDPQAPLDTALYEAHGRAQCAAGRSLRELLGIYRVSALAMWEAMSALPGTERLRPAEALELGGRWLSLMDALSSAAVDGYMAAGAEERRRDRARRDRLASLLLSEPPEPAEVIAAAAAHAGWSVPERLRAAVTHLPLEVDAGAAERAPARVLAAPYAHGHLVLLVADGDQAEALLQRAAQAHGAAGPLAIGPAVPPREAARSARRAAGLLDEVRAGVVQAAPVLRSDEHELPLILGAAPELVDGLIERRLAPLLELTGARREQVIETLGAWLAEPHRPQAIADRLGMHVGSIRYRLARLREMFGDELDDPDARFELQIALRALTQRDRSA